jgi:hypothetical protein
MIMRLPFSIEQFLSVFETYNLVIWPMQIMAYALGAMAVFMVFLPVRYSGKIITAVLAIFWLWTGMMYHVAHFSAINRAAFLFGALFAAQGILFLIYGLRRNGLDFKFEYNMSSVAGIVLISYAMLFYPLLGILLGHAYPRSPVFGVAPCPVAIFTFGILLTNRTRPPVTILVIPFLWSIVGFSAAISLGMREDIGLLVAGVIGVTLAFTKNKKPAHSA